jgi:GT2 family glycosyltransferase
LGKGRVAKTEPVVCIIVITHNGRQHLVSCLPSIQRSLYENYYVVLVDNASDDGSEEYVRSHYPRIKIIRNAENLGFAGGNNIAMRRAINDGADYVLLLNDDTVILDPTWLRKAVSVSERDPYVGMVGFDIVDNKRKRSPIHLSITPVQRIPGCAVLIRRDVLVRVGYFDENYFAYGEESDLETRAMKAGYRLAAVNVPVYHEGGGSFSRYPFRFSYLYLRNWIRYSIKNESFWMAILRPIIVFDLFCSPIPIRRNAESFRLRAKLDTGRTGLNFLIFLGAVLHNIVFLPYTVLARIEDGAKIKTTKRIIGNRNRH